jgi:hypothetical protein
MTIRELIEIVEKLFEIAHLLIQILWHRAIEWLLDLTVEEAIVLGFAACVAIIVASVIWDHWPSIKRRFSKEGE